MNYQIRCGETVRGPCSITDIESFLAYGSLRPVDLVRRMGDPNWQRIDQFEDLAPWFEQTEAARTVRTRASRRIIRHRDYVRVPTAQRSGVILCQLLVGLFLPWKLWHAAATAFNSHIYRPVTNELGFLKVWPRWTEYVIAFWIVLSATLWIVAILLLIEFTLPVFHWAKEAWDTFQNSSLF